VSERASESSAPRAGWAGARLRGLSGVLAGGLAVLVVALVGAWIAAERNGVPGPGPDTLAWHAVAAVAAVLAQRHADRRPGADGVVAALAVVAITVMVLAVQWLA
jgi:hypothetical protein